MSKVRKFLSLTVLLACGFASANGTSELTRLSTFLHVAKRSPESLTSNSPNNNTICKSDWSDLEKWVPSKEILEFFPVETPGVDYDGNPVFINKYGKWNVREWVSKHGDKGVNDFEKYFKYQIYNFIQLGTTKGRDEGAVLIFDFDGFSLAHYASVQATKLSLEQFGTLPQLYCGITYGYFVNTNFAANVFINLAKPFLGNFLNKFEIYGTQREKWIPKLLRKIPKNQLPQSYGGDLKPMNK